MLASFTSAVFYGLCITHISESFALFLIPFWLRGALGFTQHFTSRTCMLKQIVMLGICVFKVLFKYSQIQLCTIGVRNQEEFIPVSLEGKWLKRRCVPRNPEHARVGHQCWPPPRRGKTRFLLFWKWLVTFKGALMLF